MKKLKTLTTTFATVVLALALIHKSVAQASTENMKTFFNSEIPGIKIQVNATAETQPGENISVILSLKGQTDVYVEYLNVSIFGFLRGKDKVSMLNIIENDFSLNDTSTREYNRTFEVPQNVWDVTYGEILLTYSAKLGGLKLSFSEPTFGFTMTHVENVELKNVKEQLKNLNESYLQLNETFWESFQMNLTAENLALLNQTFWDLKSSMSRLDTTTRNVAIVLAITTVCFAATTIYLVMRKPKQYW